MTKAPIRVWREPIDGTTCAVIALVEFIFRGSYHMASAFLLHPVADWRGWHDAGEACLRKEIAEKHGGHVPWVRRAKDDPNAPVLSRRAFIDEGE